MYESEPQKDSEIDGISDYKEERLHPLWAIVSG